MARLCIMPFAGDLYGGGCGPNSAQTLIVLKAVSLWRRHKRAGNEVTLYCSCGLPNRNGVTIAETLAWQIQEADAEAASSIVIGEEESAHTADNIRYSLPFLVDENNQPRYDRVIAISVPGFLGLPGHVKRIRILWNNIYPNIPIETDACRPWGSWFHRLRRGIIETIEILWIVLFDHQGRFFDRFAEGRRRRAREMT